MGELDPRTAAVPDSERIGDRVIYENDRVRVWELTLDPGAESHVHRHPHDYLIICIDGDRVAGKAAPGQGAAYGPMGDFADFDTGPGHVLWVEGGVTETAVNTGHRPYRNVLVELKDERR